MQAIFRPTQPEDIFSVAADLRPEDLLEAQHYLGIPSASAESILGAAVVHSKASLTVWAGDTPVALCGVGDQGDVWFLAATGVGSVRKSLIREAPTWLDFLAEVTRLETLYAYTWVGNPQHLQWSLLVGFRRVEDTHFNDHRFTLIER